MWTPAHCVDMEIARISGLGRISQVSGNNLSIHIMQSKCIQARGIRPATRGRTIGSGVGSQGRQGHRLRALTKTSERTHADPATPTGVAAGKVALLAPLELPVTVPRTHLPPATHYLLTVILGGGETDSRRLSPLVGQGEGVTDYR